MYAGLILKVAEPYYVYRFGDWAASVEACTRHPPFGLPFERARVHAHKGHQEQEPGPGEALHPHRRTVRLGKRTAHHEPKRDGAEGRRGDEREGGGHVDERGQAAGEEHEEKVGGDGREREGECVRALLCVRLDCDDRDGRDADIEGRAVRRIAIEERLQAGAR